MYTAELTFEITQRAKEADLGDAIGDLLQAYRRNGQIVDSSFPIAASRSMIRAFVTIPERNSLSRRTNRWIRAERRKLRGVGLGLPRIVVLGRDPGIIDSVCNCRSPKCYVMYTSAYSVGSPVQCGDCFGTVPLYRIPWTTDFETYEDVLFWQRAYQHYDRLWFLRQDAEERHAYAQLGKTGSRLSREGRALCDRIEKLTERPVYYHLFRYYGRTLARERASRCPGCGKPWALADRWHRIFDFRCEKCRLVSTIASDVQTL